MVVSEEEKRTLLKILNSIPGFNTKVTYCVSGAKYITIYYIEQKYDIRTYMIPLSTDSGSRFTDHVNRELRNRKINYTSYGGCISPDTGIFITSLEPPIFTAEQSYREQKEQMEHWKRLRENRARDQREREKREKEKEERDQKERDQRKQNREQRKNRERERENRERDERERDEREQRETKPTTRRKPVKKRKWKINWKRSRKRSEHRSQ